MTAIETACAELDAYVERRSELALAQNRFNAAFGSLCDLLDSFAPDVPWDIVYDLYWCTHNEFPTEILARSIGLAPTMRSRVCDIAGPFGTSPCPRCGEQRPIRSRSGGCYRCPACDPGTPDIVANEDQRAAFGRWHRLRLGGPECVPDQGPIA